MQAKRLQVMVDKILNPGQEYTPIPFWFLNDELTDEEVVRQLRDFHEKGVDGVVLHPRLGIPETIPYLSDTFMHYMKLAVETAAGFGMYIVLYDEAMYPSGSARGMVVAENPKYASQAIILTEDANSGKVITACGDGRFIVQVNSEGTIRGIHYGEDDGEANAPAAADLLSQEAVDTFIRLTHQRYYEVLGEYFGNTIIGFFTDEPSLLGRNARKDGFPWTWDFEKDFAEAGGVLEALAALYTGEENESTKLYQQMIFQREQEIYYGSLQRFCQEHGIALMGHPHRGDDIECEKYFDVPGQDVVWRWVAPEVDGLAGHESAQGKCSSDAARIQKRRRNSNECFGVCVRDNKDWYFTGSDMKWYLDYLGVRGVNMFIPHAFFYSVAGARKDERPPDVGPNNIWWEHYEVISAYIKRLSYIMTDVVNEAKVCVMCENRNMPVEEVREFYQNQVEFNYLPYASFHESMIQDQKLMAGDNTYEYVYCDRYGVVNGIPGIQGVEDLPYRDLYTETFCPDLRVTRLRKEGVRMLFLTNEGDEKIDMPVAIDGETSLIAMDLWNGTYWRVESRAESGKTHWNLTLGYRESLLILLDESGELEAPLPAEKQYVSVDFQLTAQDPELYTKTYSGNLQVDFVDNSSSLWIAVQAEEMVECYVNGVYAGFSLWNAHEFDISRFVKSGKNEIILRVTGNAANRFTEHEVAYGLL